MLRATARPVIAIALSTIGACALFVARSPASDSSDAHTGAVALESRSFSFLAAAPPTGCLGRLAWRGGLELHSADGRFGGFSGLAVYAQGSRLIAVSDRAVWLTAELGYDQGRLATIGNARMAPLREADGSPSRADAEAIALQGGRDDADSAQGLPAASLLVGIESGARIVRYDLSNGGLAARGQSIELPAEILRGPRNKELEGLARFGPGTRLQGSLFVLSERNLDAQGDIRAWLVGGPASGPLTLARRNDFSATDAAALPDGDLLVLERRFVAGAPPAMRIRRIPAASIAPGQRLEGETLLEATAPEAQIDNMEGLAAFEMADGERRIALISDDNFSTRQRTLLMQFALDDARCGSAESP